MNINRTGSCYQLFNESLRSGNLTNLERALDLGVNPLSKSYLIGEEGGSALHVAAEHGHVSIVTKLLERFPSLINSVDHSRNTPLCVSDARCITILLNHGANINAVNLINETPLMYLAKKLNDEGIKLLFKYVGDRTLLIEGSLQDKDIPKEIVRIITGYNGDKTAKDLLSVKSFSGETPLFSAMKGIPDEFDIPRGKMKLKNILKIFLTVSPLLKNELFLNQHLLRN